MTDEREIDLLELIAEVLKHWKGMILFMLIGAIAVGGFDYAKANYNAEKKRTEEAVEMTYAEKKAVDIALEYEIMKWLSPDVSLRKRHTNTAKSLLQY